MDSRRSWSSPAWRHAFSSRRSVERARQWDRCRAPFRIDHDEKFNQTTHFQYQPWKRGPWVGFNWRYDSGLVAGATPCYGARARTIAHNQSSSVACLT
jgi:hypothetical protein